MQIQETATLTTVNAPMKIHSKRARVARVARGSRRIVRQQPLPPPAGAGAAEQRLVRDGAQPVLGELELDVFEAERRTDRARVHGWTDRGGCRLVSPI